jgi:hypothetical protein
MRASFCVAIVALTLLSSGMAVAQEEIRKIPPMQC